MSNDFKKSLKITDTTNVPEKIINHISNYSIYKENFDYLSYFSKLVSAIYLEHRKMYPNISIYFTARIKSPVSYGNNINGELERQKNFEKLDEEAINKDVFAFSIILDHLDSFNSTDYDFTNPLINKLFKKANDNITFLSKTEESLNNNLRIDEKFYYETKRKILERIIDATYKEFTAERTIPYKTELEYLNNHYSDIDEDDLSPKITNEQYNELQNLLLDLKTRVSDKLEYEIIKETFPNVLNTHLIKDQFQVSFAHDKDFRSARGFAANYYKLLSPLSNPFDVAEIQSFSKARYDASRFGPASHSLMPNKQLDIYDLFEKVDENDSTDLKEYLVILHNIPIESTLSDDELPIFKTEQEKEIFLNTHDGLKYKNFKEVEALRKKIKLKDNFEGLNMDDYLLLYAFSNSPISFVVSSGHSKVPTANVTFKSLSDSFTDILAKKDSTTCLGDILINRLQDILANLKEHPENNSPVANHYLKLQEHLKELSGTYTIQDLRKYLSSSPLLQTNKSPEHGEK